MMQASHRCRAGRSTYTSSKERFPRLNKKPAKRSSRSRRYFVHAGGWYERLTQTYQRCPIGFKPGSAPPSRCFSSQTRALKRKQRQRKTASKQASKQQHQQQQQQQQPESRSMAT